MLQYFNIFVKSIWKLHMNYLSVAQWMKLQLHRSFDAWLPVFLLKKIYKAAFVVV